MREAQQTKFAAVVLGVAEAKSKLSEVLRDTASGPTIIHSRGRDLAVLGIEEYENLVAEGRGGGGTGGAFLNRLEAVKRRHGGGVESFEPAPMDFEGSCREEASYK